MKNKKMYNKLVRDKIPQIIREDGKSCICHEASGPTLKSYAKKKLIEEVNEFLQDPCVEEAADVMEISISYVIFTTSEIHRLWPAVPRSALLAVALTRVPSLRG